MELEHTCHDVYMEVRDRKLFFFFYFLCGFRDQTQVMRLGDKCLYLLSHPASCLYLKKKYFLVLCLWVFCLHVCGCTWVQCPQRTEESTCIMC